MRRLSSSLRLRLTGAVMMPLTALVLVFSVITALVNHNTEADTVDRVLVGSVRTLSLAYNSPPADQKRLVPLVIHLLQRRARPVVHYSVYRGDRLVAGDPSLKPPADYRADWDGVTDRHPPATFKNAYRKTPLVRGYLDPADAHYVTQAAYLRSGTLHGKPVRIATEMRRAYGDDRLIAIQIADYLDDRSAYERLFLRQVLLVGVAVLLVTGLLFWWAIRWGLRPLSDLTGQVEAARREASPAFRMEMAEATPVEIKPFVAAFNGLMARLERATNSLRQFTSNASHQMRTPLAVARVHLDVLDRYGAASPQGKAALQDIPHAIDSLEQLLRQLIALARSEEDGDMRMGPFDLSEVAADVIADRAAQAPADIEIGYDKAMVGPAMAIGQPGLAAELIGNLLDNAIRYNRPGGTVTVHLYRRDGQAMVDIDDDGPGIPEAQREKVWDRFYRLPGNSATPGTGLGLPIARALADRMGAQISLADGRTGRGLCVTIAFRAE
ncbi:ATP-binding protein [Sphingobium yanoikuyae]|jgi:two-component system sensor histidine kinase TctE|uniref:histidine kinase n=1 Tax=Sphingobium yanoikuyae TaxID=13690 RepID=A0A430BE43_SPHYA|nr:ATP-binding protein [Sphingobium yanoikuyae]RSU47250.1 HAMP domain-containing protein [Sphingobium yanoikuyae]